MTGPVEAAGPVDAPTDARPQGPWTPATDAGAHSYHKASASDSSYDLASLRPLEDTHRATLGVAAFQALPPGRVSTFGDSTADDVP